MNPVDLRVEVFRIISSSQIDKIGFQTLTSASIPSNLAFHTSAQKYSAIRGAAAVWSELNIADISWRIFQCVNRSFVSVTKN